MGDPGDPQVTMVDDNWMIIWVYPMTLETSIDVCWFINPLTIRYYRIL